jgi:carboxyl-terminal processing protease
MKKFKKYLLILALSFTAFTFYSFVDQYGDKYFEIAKNLDIMATMFREVNTYYVDEIDPGNLMKTGIDAMLASLDPYTNYISEDQIEDFRTMTTGQYGGIGAIIGQRNEDIVVIMPYKGDPADEAGLKAGDKILKIDDIDITDKNTNEVSKLLKGQANTNIDLTILRYGEEEPRVLKVKRKKIKIDNIPYHGMLNNEVGYIRLTDFSIGAYSEVRSAFEDLQKEGMQKLIFDLRDNPGGSLTEAVKICSIFLPTGSKVVETKGKYEKNNSTYNTLNPPLDTADIPLVILTSESSASASEIVAGVMQDYDRGVVIGKRTFGKGLVQMTRPLVYNSQLKVTTSRYYIPSGRCIQAIDYSKKDKNGNGEEMPDSLRAQFKTAGGRIVYDGKGIKPDFRVDRDPPAPISVSLMSKNLIFDYATKFYYSHPHIAPAGEFEITDEVYTDFVSWLSDKDYDYTTDVEKTIDELISEAKAEKYYEHISDEIYTLKSTVENSKKTDLQLFKEEIKELLEQEIVSRYYYQEGMVQASFDWDNDVTKSLELFDSMETYKSTLQARK